MKELKVDAIKDGTVIDHIPAGKAFQIVEILKLKETDQVMIGTNLVSKKFGKKDIIKIENKEFSEAVLNSIALIAPSSTFSIIRNYETIKKTEVTIPSYLEGLIICQNEKCITNIEKVTTKFEIAKKEPIKVRCMYCEKVYTVDKINKFINIGHSL
jgi:aspartate carbamoyltransferase regulatory subunit